MKNIMYQILLLLAVSLIAPSCDRNEKLIEEQEKTIKQLQAKLDEAYSVHQFSDVRRVLCQKPHQLNPNTGGFIDVVTARRKINVRKKFLSDRNPGYDPKNDLRGFVLGLNPLKDLFTEIDNINRGISIPEDKIIGVRIYTVMDTITINGILDTIPDILVVPIVALKTDTSGGNYYNIDDDFNKDFLRTDVILNKSVPCPTACP